MATIRVLIGPAVDAVQRLALPLFFGAGHPNYPLWQTATGDSWINATTADSATHAVWDDHRLSGRDVALCTAIGADPARVPADVSALDRSALETLYAAELAAYEASIEVRP